jgi:cytochrome P450
LLQAEPARYDARAASRRVDEEVRTVQVRSIDLVNPDNYVNGVPFEWFDHLRREAPVYWHEEPAPNRGFWAVTRYDDLVEIHRDWRTYSAAKGFVMLEELQEDQLDARRSLIETDPPRHSALRNLVSKQFTKRAVAVYEDYVRELARSIVDDALGKEEFDFVTEISRLLPMRALCAIMGIPVEDADRLVTLADAMVGHADPEYTTAVIDRDDTDAYRELPFRSPAGAEVFAYADELRRRRRSDPRDDVMTVLATGRAGGVALTDPEYRNYFSLLVVAGNETTRHTISHGMLALLERREQLDRLANDPGIAETAAEEMIRWATPAMHFRRTAMRDVELRGQRIRAGDKVVTWYISANRDELVFDDPYRFDIARSPNPQVAFGPHGASLHFCLGADLARMEVAVLFQELLPRLRSIDLAGPVERLRSNFHNGVKHLPVRAAAR